MGSTCIESGCALTYILLGCLHFVLEWKAQVPLFMPLEWGSCTCNLRRVCDHFFYTLPCESLLIISWSPEIQAVQVNNLFKEFTNTFSTYRSNLVMHLLI